MPLVDMFKTDKQRFLDTRDTSWMQKYGGAVPYYPSQRYIDKNLGPELGMAHTQIDALAKANQEARRNKLLPTSIADKMLPTALAEGATGTRGWGYPDTPIYRDILKKAGLPEKDPHKYVPTSDYDEELHHARMMHAVMAAKVLNYGEDNALERWNGKGKRIIGKYTLADSFNHKNKVEEIARLLDHPKNSAMKNTWNTLMTRYANPDIPDMTENTTPAVQRNPSLLDTIQSTMRNWTAY
jgi:hypothetical protein